MGYRGPVAMEAFASGEPEAALDAFRRTFTIRAAVGAAPIDAGEYGVRTALAAGDTGRAGSGTCTGLKTVPPADRTVN